MATTRSKAPTPSSISDTLGESDMIRWGKRTAFRELASSSPGDTFLQATTRIRPTQSRQDLRDKLFIEIISSCIPTVIEGLRNANPLTQGAFSKLPCPSQTQRARGVLIPISLFPLLMGIMGEG